MNNTVSRTILVAASVSFVCSIFISISAVLLRPIQQNNILIDKQIKILQAAGLYDPELAVEKQFEQISAHVVDIETGEIVNHLDAKTYNPIKTAKSGDEKLSSRLSIKEDIAKIGSRERYSVVYLLRHQQYLDKIILPIRGYGLWSTMYGFLALEADTNTVAGISFYQHGETPGLGGEIDNPVWKEKWIGKKMFKNDYLAMEVVKGIVSDNHPSKDYRIDGLAGATLTTRGVNNLIQYWLGLSGFQSFLTRIKNGEY